MNFKKINNITGWAVCLIACMVYILTAEATGSFWDCGEFVSSCFKVEIPHPPGAPLFVLMGRFFTILFGDNPMNAAKAVNVMNALASGFTILFLFWTITYFARKIILGKDCYDVSKLTSSQIINIMGAGVVGALAFTFTDSFWYSAVEGEVYALSSFYTAVVFWGILKWDAQADEPGADKWLVFIFFMIGLSIGVHLLSLLNIPAIVMMYYFRRRKYMNYKLIRKYFFWITAIGGGCAMIMAYLGASGETLDGRIPVDNTVGGLMLLGTLIAIGLLYLVEKIDKNKKEYYGGIYIFFIIACALTGFTQIAVIQYSIKCAGYFDIFFVNSLGLPFFSGFIAFFVLLAVAIWWGLRVAAKRDWPYLRLGLWCFTFILIGYSSYLTTMIRSNADPAIDMFNVDNPMSLVGYLGREQYGDFPLLYGQKFTTRPAGNKETSTRYEKGEKKYLNVGKNMKSIYMKEDKMVFPRVWDASNDQYHAEYYANYLGIGKTRDGSYERDPDFSDNIKFFIGYQNYYMYFRYFMWNFSGKQNDVQGIFMGNPRDGNWITGIPFIDNMIYGDQSTMPDSLKNNKANNKLFALPFILGMIGLFYHFRRRGDDALVAFMLFFFTGLAIVVYLNQAGFQPRERDYAYAGSFYAFAIWIGLGVMKVKEWFGKVVVNQSASAVIATTVCLLAVPVVMAQQEWDDHDRSKKLLAPDLAKDYLESCDQNAILFTFGDNDTYPLWYAQEVEGVRPDIRIINTSLLGIDWYINQLRYKVNKSDPIDVIWSLSQLEGGGKDFIVYHPNNAYPENSFYDLYDIMKNYAGSDDPERMALMDNGQTMNAFPTRNFFVSVDTAFVRKNGTVNVHDTVLTEMRFSISQNYLQIGQSAILNIIAANKWKRPIYFTNRFEDLGFGNYLRRDGLSYRLVPVANNNGINTDWMTDKLLNKFKFGNANVPGVYFDEENRRHLNTIRTAYAELGVDLAEKGRKEEARKVLQRADKNMLQENFPYGMVSRSNQHNLTSLMFLEACYKAEDKELIEKVKKSVKKDLEQQLKYLNSLTGERAMAMAYDKENTKRMLDMMNGLIANYEKAAIPSPETHPALPGDSGKLGAKDTSK